MTEPVRSGRETRLLALVIVIAIAALMLLAQFRYPGVAERNAVAPPPGPLDLIATRPSFHELGSSISALAERLTPSFVVVDTVVVPPAPPGNGRRSRPAGAAATPVVISETMPTRKAALRISSDRALVHLPATSRIVTIGGAEDSKPEVVADAAHEIALIRVPFAAEPSSLLAAGAGPLTPFTYVAVIEGAKGGPTTRPVFVGRLDEMSDAAWSAPLAVIGGSTDITPGALLFSLDGRFAGVAIKTPDGLAIVPPRALNTIVTALLNQKNDSPPGGGGVKSRF